MIRNKAGGLPVPLQWRIRGGASRVRQPRRSRRRCLDLFCGPQQLWQSLDRPDL